MSLFFFCLAQLMKFQNLQQNLEREYFQYNFVTDNESMLYILKLPLRRGNASYEGGKIEIENEMHAERKREKKEQEEKKLN